MVGIIFLRCAARTLLSAPRSQTLRIREAARHHWTTLKGTTAIALNSGRGAFLLGLPTVSYLGYDAFRRVQSSAVVHALETEEVLEQADYLYSCAETEKLYQLLLQYKDSDDAEFLWRLARASRDVSVMPNVAADQKKTLTYEAFEYAKKALERDEGCFAAHKWYAVCLSDVGEYEGVKVKIGNSYIIRAHLERAVELNPKDATSIYILGQCVEKLAVRWVSCCEGGVAAKKMNALRVDNSARCFAFAELPWYQRKVAAVIFASPPSATYEEALAFFLKAEEVDPNFYSKNLLMLGKTYMALSNKESALLWLTKARDYPPHTLEDKEVHKEAAELLKKLG